MLGKIAGPVVLACLVISVIGSILGRENIEVTGILTLLFVATIAGYTFIKFSVVNPVRELTGICISKSKVQDGYNFTFKLSGSQLYSGKSGIKQGEKIKIGEKAKLKVKGNIIIELEKYEIQS